MVRHGSASIQSPTSLFVFGGETAAGALRNDLWEFDARSRMWTELSPDGAAMAPPPRHRNAAAFDRGRVVIFGGEDQRGNVLGDTWEWDTASGSWTQVSFPVSPPARRDAAMAFEPYQGNVLLYGGEDGSGTVLGDTWIYGSGIWSQFTGGPFGSGNPGPRAGHSLVSRGSPWNTVLLFGGHDGGAAPNRIHHLDHWVYDGFGWRGGGMLNTFAATFTGYAAVHDQLRDRIVVHGGKGISEDSALTGGAYGMAYGGSSSGWTSEFDGDAGAWLLYGDGAFQTPDPVVGLPSDYYAAFLIDRVYMWGGRDPSGVGVPLSMVKEYQADPVATAIPFGTACANSRGRDLSINPIQGASYAAWSGREFHALVDGLMPGASAVALLGLPMTPVPLFSLFPTSGSCALSVQPFVNLPLSLSARDIRLQIPADVTNLVGVPFRLQALQFEAGRLSASRELRLGVAAL